MANNNATVSNEDAVAILSNLNGNTPQSQTLAPPPQVDGASPSLDTQNQQLSVPPPPSMQGVTAPGDAIQILSQLKPQQEDTANFQDKQTSAEATYAKASEKQIAQHQLVQGLAQVNDTKGTSPLESLGTGLAAGIVNAEDTISNPVKAAVQNTARAIGRVVNNQDLQDTDLGPSNQSYLNTLIPPSQAKAAQGKHPFLYGSGEFVGGSGAMMALPQIPAEAIAAKTIATLSKFGPIAQTMVNAAKVTQNIPKIGPALNAAANSMIRTGIGNFPVSTLLAVHQNMEENKGQINYKTLTPEIAGYTAGAMAAQGVMHAIGAAAQVVSGQVSRQMQRAAANRPAPATFQGTPSTGAMGSSLPVANQNGLVSQILGNTGNVPFFVAHAKINIGNKTVEFQDLADKALYQAGRKPISSKEGLAARNFLQSLGMSDEQIMEHSAKVVEGTKALAKGATGATVQVGKNAAQNAVQQDIDSKANETIQKEAAKALATAQKDADKATKQLAKSQEAEKKAQEKAQALMDKAEKSRAKKVDAAHAKANALQQKEEQKAIDEAWAAHAKAKGQTQADQKMRDKANEEWAKWQGTLQGTIVDDAGKPLGQTNFGKRQENWDYRQKGIPEFSVNDISNPQEKARTIKAMNAIAKAEKSRVRAEKIAGAAQQVFSNLMGIAPKVTKDIFQEDRVAARLASGVRTTERAPQLNVLPKFAEPIPIDVQTHLDYLERQAKAGKDVRNAAAAYYNDLKKSADVAKTAANAIRDKTFKVGNKVISYEDQINRHMPLDSQTERGDVNFWRRSGDKIPAEPTTEAETDKLVQYNSATKKLASQPAKTNINKADLHEQHANLTAAIKEAHTNAQLFPNANEQKVTRKVLQTLGELPKDVDPNTYTLPVHKILTPALKTASWIINKMGGVIPDRGTVRSICATINNYDVYEGTGNSDVSTYLKGLGAKVQRQSLGVEFPKTPEVNAAYRKALVGAADPIKDDAILNGEGIYSKMAPSLRNFVVYARQQRAEAKFVLQGVKDRLFNNDAGGYNPPLNPFSSQRQLWNVLNADIEAFGGPPNPTNLVAGKFLSDTASNFYAATLSGKVSPHLLHLVGAIQNNTAEDPMWMVKVAMANQETPAFAQALSAFHNQGPLRSFIDEQQTPTEDIRKAVNDAVNKQFGEQIGWAQSKMTPEQWTGFKSFMSGATTEEAKTYATRAAALVKAAENEARRIQRNNPGAKFSAGQAAQALLDDMQSQQANPQALRLHADISQYMLDHIGKSPDAFRATTLFDHMPITKVTAPFNYERQVNSALWTGFITDAGEHFRAGNTIEGLQSLAKATTHTAIGVAYLGSKAIPAEMLLAQQYFSPDQTAYPLPDPGKNATKAQKDEYEASRSMADRLDSFNIVGRSTGQVLSHMQPQLSPTAHGTGGFIDMLARVPEQTHLTGYTQEAKTDEQTYNRYAKAAEGIGYVGALAGFPTVGGLGTEAGIQYLNALAKVGRGTKTKVYRSEPTGVPILGLGMIGGDILHTDKNQSVNNADEFIHALTGSVPYAEQCAETDYQGNEAARLAYLSRNAADYNLLLSSFKAAGVNIPVRNIDWMAAYDAKFGPPRNVPADEMQKAKPALKPGESGS